MRERAAERWNGVTSRSELTPGSSRAMAATAASHWLRRRLYSEPSRCRAEPVWSTTSRMSSGSGTARQSSERQSSRTAAPATPHASANWSIKPLWTPT